MAAASSTLEQSLGRVAVQFTAACQAAAADATALFRVIYGLADGKDYGRYFFGQDPLVSYVDGAGSVDGLVARNVALIEAVDSAAAGLLAAQTDPTSFYSAGSALTETVRLACANPADAIRLLTGLVQFQALIAGNDVAGDPLGQEIALLTALGAHTLRLAAAGSLIRASADYVPSSRDDAETVRDAIAELLDDLELYCADIFDDATATALGQARAALIEDMGLRGATEPPAATLKLYDAVPALTLAYRLYDDVSREGDLLARNPNAADPGFMPLAIEALLA